MKDESQLWVSDDELERRLQRYYWLIRVAPNIYIVRFVDLVEEANRRGKPEIVGKD